MKQIQFFSMLLLAVVLLAYGCKKDKTETRIRVKLTDAPAAFEEVNVDIRGVKVNYRDDSSGWVSLDTRAGIYNLLALQGGVDTLLATGVIPSDVVKEIRLFLGPDNSIKVSGQTYPLLMNNGDQPKLMIKVNKQLNASLDSLVVDFDAGLSVVQQGNNNYRLLPVLRLK